MAENETEVGTEEVSEQYVDELIEQAGIDIEETPDEPAPEADEKEDAPAVKEKPEPSTVPITALHEERERAREYKRQLDEFRNRQAEAERQAAERTKAEAEKVPEFEYDPTGNLDHRLKSQAEKLAEIERINQQQQAMQQLNMAIQSHESSFIKEHDDYYHALEHVRNIEREKMKPIAAARGLTNDQVETIIHQEELRAAMQLLQMGINPAEYAYKAAQTYGFNGPVKKDSGFETLQRGVKQSKSLGSGSSQVAPESEPGVLEEFDMAMKEMFPGYR